MNAEVVNEIINKWFRDEVLGKTTAWKKFKEELEQMQIFREVDGVPQWIDADEWERVMAGEKQKEHFCVDCRYHQENYADLHICDRPVVDMVTGVSKKRGKKCEFERAYDCGPEGRFWKQRASQFQLMGGVKYAEEDDGA